MPLVIKEASVIAVVPYIRNHLKCEGTASYNMFLGSQVKHYLRLNNKYWLEIVYRFDSITKYR